MRRCIGLDVHREFAQVAIWEDGVIWQAGRIQTTPEALRTFAASLCVSDEVALEATGNTHAIARLLERQVGRVVVSNPQKTRAIAEAKVKTDKVDAAVLAATSSVAARPPTCSATRAGPGWPPKTSPQTSSRPCRRCCASSTFTARNCGSSTPSSAGSPSSAPRSADS